MATVCEVKTFEKIKVKIVTSFPDLLVYVTKNKNESKGKDELWYFEEKSTIADLKIKFVSNFEDLKIQYVKGKNQAGWKNKTHRLISRLH